MLTAVVQYFESDQSKSGVVCRDHPEIISDNRYLHRLAGNIRMDFEIHPDIFLVSATQTIRLLIPDIISG